MMNIRTLIFYFTTTVSKKLVHSKLFVERFSIFKTSEASEIDVNRDIIKWLKSTGVKVALLTSLLVFFVNLFWSLIAGNFCPDNLTTTRTFWEDTSGLIYNAVICPIYTMLCLCFIRHIPYLRINLQKQGVFDSIGYKIESDQRKMKLKMIFLGVLVIVVSALATILYIIDVNRFKFRFWYQEFINNQDKILNAQGYYYFAMSFILIAISYALVVAHFELFSASARIGKLIDEKLKSDEEWDCTDKMFSKEGVGEMFSPLISLYVVSKLLVVTYLASVYTWQARFGFAGMHDGIFRALAVFGTAIVSYPRYHVQYYIFKLWKKHGINEYPDLRSPIQVGLTSLADFLILGGIMANIIAYVLK